VAAHQDVSARSRKSVPCCGIGGGGGDVRSTPDLDRNTRTAGQHTTTTASHTLDFGISSRSHAQGVLRIPHRLAQGQQLQVTAASDKAKLAADTAVRQ
jgi:hypothetical protein